MKFGDFCKRLAAGTAVLLMGAGCLALGTVVASIIESAGATSIGLAVGSGVAVKAWSTLSPLRMQLLNYVAEGEWKSPGSSKERTFIGAFKEMAHQDNPSVATAVKEEPVSQQPKQQSKFGHFCKRLAAGAAVLLVGVGCVGIGVAVASTISLIGGGSTTGLGVVAGSFAAASAWEKFSPLRRQLLTYAVDGEWKPVKECKEAPVSEMAISKAKKLIGKVFNFNMDTQSQKQGALQIQHRSNP